jgi:hypothetical protein
LPFLWILSFGNAKESISPVGARTDFKSARCDSDTMQSSHVGKGISEIVSGELKIARNTYRHILAYALIGIKG